MAINRVLTCVVIVGASVLFSVDPISAQSDETFKGRLSAVPVTLVTLSTTTGSGTLTAVLEGSTLAIDGEFDGMNSPATVAHLHRAPRGLRGPRAFDLIVTKATSGAVKGSLTLTTDQAEELKNGGYYIQIHTEQNPDGQLRGWLLKEPEGTP